MNAMHNPQITLPLKADLRWGGYVDDANKNPIYDSNIQSRGQQGVDIIETPRARALALVKAFEIAQWLAEWSIEYSSSNIFDYKTNETLCEKLDEIESKAKAWFRNLTTQEDAS
jgi:hypothetical protein